MHEIHLKFIKFHLLHLALKKHLNQNAPTAVAFHPADKWSDPEAHQEHSAGFQPSCNHKKVSNSTQRCSIYRRWIMLQSLRPAKTWFPMFLSRTDLEVFMKEKKVNQSWGNIRIFPSATAASLGTGYKTAAMELQLQGMGDVVLVTCWRRKTSKANITVKTKPWMHWNQAHTAAMLPGACFPMLSGYLQAELGHFTL